MYFLLKPTMPLVQILQVLDYKMLIMHTFMKLFHHLQQLCSYNNGCPNGIFFSPGLQTPTLYINNTQPYESEEFTAVCSAPEEKGALIFRIYQRFANGESEIIKQLAPSVNSSETTLVLRPVGDRVLYCDYEINLVSGPRRSNHSKEISMLVKGDSIKSHPPPP